MTTAYDSDPIFETTPRQLSNIITRIRNREIALPDFQRDFRWDSDSTEELIRSIVSRYPAGTLLFWKQGEEEVFASRHFEGAPPLAEKMPAELVLDGQQRLTSLYQALTGTGDDRYYIKLDQFVDTAESRVLEVHEVDFEKAIYSHPAEAARSAAVRKIDPSVANSYLPLSEVGQFDDWLDEYVDLVAGDLGFESKALKSLYRSMRDKYLIPLRSYGFPVVVLPETTPIEAVCNIFETLNRTGKRLGPFELLTARYYPKNVNLRELWAKACNDYPILQEFGIDPYSILQIITLRAHNSAQRSDVLKRLSAPDIETHWTPAVKGMVDVLDMLQSECGVFSPRWLPYSMVLIPMAAVWHEIQAQKPLTRSIRIKRLQEFFWSTVFTTNYDQGANSQAGADHTALKKWAVDGDDDAAPEAVGELPISVSTIRNANVRRKALYAGVMCLLVRNKAEDFHTGQAMTLIRATGTKIDSHHIFPKAYLSRNGERESAELILNRSLIDAETNRIIKDRAPSEYLHDMQEVYGKEKLSSVLASHGISYGDDCGLNSDSYQKFLDERAEDVAQLIEEVTGRSVDRS